MNVYAEREGINITELLEEQGFAFHNGHSSFGTDISKAENCRSIRYDRNVVPFVGVVIDQLIVFVDNTANVGDAGSVSQRHGLHAINPDSAFHLELAT